MYKMLNKIANPTMAPMEIQKPPSVVKSPFALRIALPTVGASIEVSLFGCNNIERLKLIEMLPLQHKDIMVSEFRETKPRKYRVLPKLTMAHLLARNSLTDIAF
jgi:hypothetical protein